MTFEEFSQIKWLHSIWKPHPDEAVIVVESPEDFYEQIYRRPYEDWCVQDHKEAEKLDPSELSRVTKVAESAYLEAWSVYPSPEFCALLSDDVHTIGSLILLNNGVLRRFTRERLGWYAGGRFPCGFDGRFPEGKWIIA